ncbi:MAG: hypothetical protein HMLKMBBP_02049 [Planctomycetes bacterium]|nr:hypothetical protein [Planctomycetota bacterium]
MLQGLAVRFVVGGVASPILFAVALIEHADAAMLVLFWIYVAVMLVTAVLTVRAAALLWSPTAAGFIAIPAILPAFDALILVLVSGSILIVVRRALADQVAASAPTCGSTSGDPGPTEGTRPAAPGVGRGNGPPEGETPDDR